MASIIVAPGVENELWEIWEFIAKDNPEAATRVVEAAKATFRTLAENPALDRKRSFKNRRLRDVRSWQVSGFENYVIFYRGLGAGIEVIHVYHGARDIDALFDQE